MSSSCQQAAPSETVGGNFADLDRAGGCQSIGPNAGNVDLKHRPVVKYDRTVEHGAHRPHEGEWIGPAGLPAGPRGQQDQTIGARLDRLLGMAQRGDIREHEAADIMQRLNGGRR